LRKKGSKCEKIMEFRNGHHQTTLLVRMGLEVFLLFIKVFDSSFGLRTHKVEKQTWRKVFFIE
jgi:hypothetical protein